MPADTAQLDFLHYLMCDLPMGYPLKTPVAKLLDPSLTTSRRELLHQQSDFIDCARHYLPTQPWIPYLATVKHETVLVTIPTYAVHLVDIVDQHFFDELQAKCKDLRESSRAAIDGPTALICERLVLLQSEGRQIDDALKNVTAALDAGFAMLEPLPSAPPEPVPAKQSLLHFTTVIGASFLVGSVIPSEYGGWIWTLIGFVLTGAVAVHAVRKEKARVKNDGSQFGTYIIHESYYALCKKSISLVLALPFDIRKNALTDLAPCKQALEQLPIERDGIEAAYITPFFLR